MTVQHRDPASGPRRLDLEEIEGLGQASAQKLRAAGIHSVAELSDFRDPAELQEFLRHRSVTISADRIMNRGGRKGNWVTQARRHHARTWVVDFTADRAEDPPTWTTTVSSEQLGIEQPFPGTDPSSWARWILEQSVVPAAGEPCGSAEPSGGPGGEAVADGKPTVAAEEKRFEIALLDFVEVAQDVDRHRGELEARIEVSARGSGPDTAGESAPYCRLEILAVNEETGLPLLLGSTVERLARRGSSQPATVRFSPPDLGAYRLVCLGFLFVPGLRLASAEGPHLTVVERQ